MPADPALPRQAPPGTEAVVVGGGIAGISAAVVLAERGVRVTLLEAAPTLGGRLGAWPHQLSDGSTQVVEHGFHAFFRHYYTWRAILRRIDPQLRFLAPAGSYPVISREWPAEDLDGLPARAPWNLITLFTRSPSLGLRDLLGSRQRLATELLAYAPGRTAAAFDHIPAAAFLQRLRLSDRAVAMLFEAFARSFFADPAALSAAELIAMFHYYFVANPQGIGFDVPITDHASAIWEPLSAHLREHGAEIVTAAPVTEIAPADGHRWSVRTAGAELRTRHLVLAVDPGALKTLIAASPGLTEQAPVLARKVAALQLAAPFAVTRLWLDRDVAPHRAAFSAVSREPTLDSVAVYSRLERPSIDWAARTGGAVVELHSYATRAPDAATATARMRAELAALWPETADAEILDVHELYAATAPAFPPGGAADRLGVTGAARGVRLAGDHVATPWLTGLMERSAATGVLAANDVLAEVGAGPEELRCGPQHGLLWRLPPYRWRP
ncbi:isorenieratene synthase [Pseudonocardia thermophila]|uniref:Isorenieratene synthase n=1 Tax=Pseudonocardia thermophila TaxID=1848 RepID=A0A1M6NG65_PSETH|nr:isorenieratene synthase [Pseudonocardia thermophila]